MIIYGQPIESKVLNVKARTLVLEIPDRINPLFKLIEVNAFGGANLNIDARPNVRFTFFR